MVERDGNCARATPGHAAALPRAAMNSRRLQISLLSLPKGRGKLAHSEAERVGPTHVAERHRRAVGLLCHSPIGRCAGTEYRTRASPTGIGRWAASRAGSRVWAQPPMARNSCPRRYSHSGNCRPGSDRQRFGRGGDARQHKHFDDDGGCSLFSLFLVILVTVIRFWRSGGMSNSSAVFLIAVFSSGASTSPKCSARLRMISTDQRGMIKSRKVASGCPSREPH